MIAIHLIAALAGAQLAIITYIGSMKRWLTFLISFIVCMHVEAQRGVNRMDTTATRQFIDSINRAIDRAVVNKQMNTLQKYYADDFVFTHGTGLVDSKESWLQAVSNPSLNYISREHDSTLVELHKNVAIITGVLTVKRKTAEEIATYALRYVRVYALRNKLWKMISHRTTAEWHLD